MRIDPQAPRLVSVGRATDLAADAAVAGNGIVSPLQDWLSPHLEGGVPEPVLEPWWQAFSGPVPYLPGRRLAPVPLRAFIGFIKGRPE